MLIGSSGSGFIREHMQRDINLKLADTRRKREVVRKRTKGESRHGMYTWLI